MSRFDHLFEQPDYDDDEFVYQETVKGRQNRAANRNLKAIGYDKAKSAIIVEDPETKERYSINIVLMDNNDVEEMIGMYGFSLDEALGINPNDRCWKASAKKICMQLAERTLPAMKAAQNMNSKLGAAEVNSSIMIPRNLLTRLKKEEFKAIVDHEIQHAHQERMGDRGSGEVADRTGYGLKGGKLARAIGGKLQSSLGLAPEMRVGSNATTEWIKQYVNSPAGRNLESSHDKFLFELEADAVSVRKNGAKTYTQALMHLYGMMASIMREETIAAAKESGAARLDKNIKALHDLRTYLNLHKGEIDDATLSKYIKMSESPVDKAAAGASQIVKQIKDIKSYAATNKIPLNVGTVKEIMKTLGSVEKVSNSFSNPYTTLNPARKEKLLKLPPEKRVAYVDKVYTRCLEARKENVNVEKQLAKVNKQLEDLKRGFEARCEFCRAIEKAAPWTKAAVAEFVAMVPDLFGIVFSEEYTMLDLANDILSDECVFEMFDGYEDPLEDLIVEYLLLDDTGDQFIQEEDQLSDDETVTVGDLNLEDDDSEDDDPVGLPGYIENRMSEEDLEMMDSGNYTSDEEDDDLETFKSTGKESEGKILDEGDLEEYGALVTDEDMERARGPIQPDEPAPDEQISASAVDLGTMGSDTSDHQNDYDPKEIELLMKLMASEADAMNEYLQGAKDTNIDVLRRLFADIGNEERFHMEQLLYAKCELTGEKYEPKDPDVKSEYEELLKMGMDEETAMQTAIDKCHIRGSISIEETNDEAVSLKEDTATLEQYAHNCAFMIDQFMKAVDNEVFDPEKYDKANDTFLECFIVTEGAYIGDDNGADAGNGGINVKKHPLRAIHNIIGTLLDLIQKLINKIKQLITNLRNRSREIKRFLKRYSLAGIFKDGIRMYFYDLDNPAEVNNALDQWLVLVCDVIHYASKQVGVNATLMSHPENVQRSPRLMINGDVGKGITLLNQVQLTKSKTLFPEDKAKQVSVEM